MQSNLSTMKKFLKKSAKFVKKTNTVNLHNASMNSTCDSYDIDGFEYVYDDSITTEKVEQPSMDEVKQPIVKKVEHPPVERVKRTCVRKMVPVDKTERPGKRIRVTVDRSIAKTEAKLSPPKSKDEIKSKNAVDVPRKTCPNDLHGYEGCLCGTQADCYRYQSKIEKDPHNTGAENVAESEAELDVTQESTTESEVKAPSTLNSSQEVPKPAKDIAQSAKDTFTNDRGAFLIVLFFVAVWMIKLVSNLNLVSIIVLAICFALALALYLKPKRLEFVLI